MRSGLHDGVASRLFARLAACLLLVAIGADLFADVDCAPHFTATADADRTLTAPAGGGAASDACAQVCVPDCFCCSTSVAAAARVLPPAPAFRTVAEPESGERWRQGLRPVLDLPPLLLS
jgi:hypothetical protein